MPMKPMRPMNPMKPMATMVPATPLAKAEDQAANKNIVDAIYRQALKNAAAKTESDAVASGKDSKAASS